jgi:hypothetical protein
VEALTLHSGFGMLVAQRPRRERRRPRQCSVNPGGARAGNNTVLQPLALDLIGTQREVPEMVRFSFYVLFLAVIVGTVVTVMTVGTDEDLAKPLTQFVLSKLQ